MLKTINFTKEDAAGFVLNPDQTLPGPWWVPSGLQPPNQSDDCNNYNQHINPSTCLTQLGVGQDQQKSAGDKTSTEGEKDSQNQQGNTANSSPGAHQQNNYFQIRLGQPMVSMTNSPQPDQLYGLFPGYGPQAMGSVMLPMSMAADDEKVYVNPKQYHRILCRRKIRDKAALQLKARQAKDKPYVHESRHLHAMRRPRGAGGRFLTSKELESQNYIAGNDKTSVTDKISPHQHEHQQLSNPSRSSSSEVLQGEIGNLNSPTTKGKSNPHGSEVTSVLYSRQLDWFHPQLPSSVVVDHDHGCFDFLKA